jgi:uncharacterized membrane protein YdjX (TVP38/TMEM64 family)
VEEVSAPSRRASAIRLALLALVGVALVVAGRMLPVPAWAEAAVGPLRRAGVLGALAFGVIYAAATVLMVPGSALTLLAGYVYGAGWGTVLVSIASTAGAALAFGLARTALRNAVRRRLASSPKLSALDRAVAQRGALVVFLLRLTPAVPFNLLNYALGGTGVRFGSYVLASWVGMLPGTVLFVSLGAALGPRGRLGPHGRVYLGVVIAVTLGVVVALGRLARRALGDAVEPAGKELP